MTDKPDAAKDAGRTDSPGAKRPHATLDLKATEVKPTPAPGASAPPAASSSSAPGAAASAASASAPASSGPVSSGSPSATKPASAAASDASAKSSSTSSAASSSSSAPPKFTPGTKPEAKPAGKSGGGFFSHLAAGVIGGGLVYAGSAFLGPDWNASNTTTSELAARVAALEATPKSDALAAKVDEAETRLAKLEELQQSVAALSETQQALETETRSLAQAAQNGDAAASAERVAKLEEQLSMIASSAPASDGGVPQVAALAGKISDLESSLANQIAGLRKSVPGEIDQRLAATAEASEAAKSAASRLDRELAQMRTDQARGAQQAESQKANMDRLSAAVEAVKEEAGRLSSVVGELRASVEAQLKSVAKPADVSAAVDPVANKLAALEQNVQNVVKSEETRKQNAERIVLSLELSNLKRALDRGQGQGYAAELDEVRKAAAGQLDLAALERFKAAGVATVAELKAEFRPVMHAVIDADLEPADGSVLDRLLAGAKSVVRVRRISHEADDASAEAIVARIEAALNDGRLGDVIAQAKALPQKAQAPIEDWLSKVNARHAVDQAIAAVENRLKASLSGAPEPAAPTGPPAAPPAAAPAQN
jgi:hypothetical protein